MEESGGNPFWNSSQELATTDPRLGQKWPRLAGLGELPPAVAASLAGELARLDPRDRAISAKGAAVIGDTFELHLAAAAAGSTEAEALAAVDALVGEGTVRSTELPGRFRFRHPIVRRAAYESASPGHRLLAHRRVAEQLASAGASPLERAQHVAASATPGDRAAAELLVTAARAAAVHAPAIAADWFGAALRLLPRGNSRDRAHRAARGDGHRAGLGRAPGGEPPDAPRGARGASARAGAAPRPDPAVPRAHRTPARPPR